MAIDIPTIVVVTTGSTYVAELYEHKPLTVKPLLAGAALGTALYLLALASESFAVGLGTVVMVTALLINGKPLASALSTIGSGNKHG